MRRHLLLLAIILAAVAPGVQADVVFTFGGAQFTAVSDGASLVPSVTPGGTTLPTLNNVEGIHVYGRSSYTVNCLTETTCRDGINFHAWGEAANDYSGPNTIPAAWTFIVTSVPDIPLNWTLDVYLSPEQGWGHGEGTLTSGAPVTGSFNLDATYVNSSDPWRWSMTLMVWGDNVPSNTSIDLNIPNSSIDINPPASAAVPEPGSWLLLASVVGWIGLSRRRLGRRC